MIRVLIVEDSRVAQEFMVHILTSDPAIEVIGVANDGAEALELVKEKHPDIITMDIHMPRVNGFEATRAIMESVPTPIVIVSSNASVKEITITYRALAAGALAVILQPPGIGHPGYEAAARELVRTVKLMSEIKVVKRFTHAQINSMPLKTQPRVASVDAGIQVIAIGASTGGPPALNRILSCLPNDLAVPVLIVQHIANGFVAGFVDWLTNASHFPVHIASQGEYLLPGQGYVAPENFHMGVACGLRISLSDGPPENNGLRPSVAHLFRSVAQVFGSHAVGVLLTGMGRDGAQELRMMKDKGAVTIAQDEASSVVHGMPGEAIKLGAAMYILPPEEIAAMLAGLIRKANGGLR